MPWNKTLKPETFSLGLCGPSPLLDEYGNGEKAICLYKQWVNLMLIVLVEKKGLPSCRTPKAASNELGVLAVYGLLSWHKTVKGRVTSQLLLRYMVHGCPTNTMFYV